MADLEVEIMLEDHPHLFVIDVESVLEAEQLRDKSMKCKVCGHEGFVAKVGIPGRKQRVEKPKSEEQKSMFKE